MKKLKKGFTIVELVIVIAVIGILSAVLIPTFANLIGDAKEAKIKAEVSNAYTAYLQVHATDDEYLAQDEVYFSDDDLATVYHFNGSEWAKVTTTTAPANGYSVSLGEYNGYHLYEAATA